MYTLVIGNVDDRHKDDATIMPSAHLVQNKPYKIYHFYDDYISNQEDVTGYVENRALKQESNCVKMLRDGGDQECELIDEIEWNYPYEIQIFSRYYEGSGRYSIEFRGIVSESLFGYKNSNNDIELFGTRLNIVIQREDNSVYIEPESDLEVGEYKLIKQSNTNNLELNTKCESNFVRIGYTQSQLEILDHETPIFVH